MTITGQNLLTGLSGFLNDLETSTTTSAGAAGGSTLVDTYLRKYQDNRLQGRYVRIATAGTNQYAVRTIDSNADGSGTVDFTTPFPAQIGAAVSYELHKYDPLKKFRALDEATYDAFSESYVLVYDETVTADGITDTFAVPESITAGPITAWIEQPLASLNILWNFQNSSDGTSTDNWTATNCTAEVVDTNYTDRIIPKYDFSGTILTVTASTAASFSQTVANTANSLTASDAKGRKMTLAKWVYCEDASRVTLKLTDDSGSTSSSAHTGNGWQLLVLEHDVDGANATTLTQSIEITSGDATKVALSRGWLYYGDKQRVTEVYNDQTFPNVRHDYNTHTVTLPTVPMRGAQLRFVGQGKLSSLGTNPSTQATNTMELTEDNARVLYAYASELLLEWEGLTSNDVPSIYQRIAIIKERHKRLGQFAINQPTRSATTPYWR